MSDESSNPEKPKPENGYLVLRLKIGEGFTIDNRTEIRVGESGTKEVKIAVRAPRDVKIRKLK